MATRRPSRVHPQPLTGTSGPWQGVFERRELIPNNEALLLGHVNGLLVDGKSRPRPGLVELELPAIFAPIQYIGSARRPAGPTVNVLVAAGALYTGVDATPSVAVDLTGFALDPEAPVYGVSFAGYLILSDGVNRPIKLDLATLTVSHLTHFAEAAYGAPTVYYGKLFFIRAANRAEITWSEEGDPDTGYTGPCAEGGTYNNAWELRQTDQDALEAILGTNEALLYWRTDGIGAIQGAVAVDFQTTGVFDALSETIGTRSPGSVVRTPRGAVFVDQHGELQRVTLGAGVVPLLGAAASTRTEDVERLASTRCGVLPEMGLVLCTQGAFSPIVVDPEADGMQAPGVGFHGRWQLGIEALGRWRIADVERLVIAEDTVALAFVHSDAGTHEDVYLAGTMPFDRDLSLPPMLAGAGVVKRYDLAQVEVRRMTPTATEGVTLATLHGSILTPIPSGSGERLWAQAGLDDYGTELVVELGTTGPGSNYELLGLTVVAHSAGEQPEPV